MRSCAYLMYPSVYVDPCGCAFVCCCMCVYIRHVCACELMCACVPVSISGMSAYVWSMCVHVHVCVPMCISSVSVCEPMCVHVCVHACMHLRPVCVSPCVSMPVCMSFAAAAPSSHLACSPVPAAARPYEAHPCGCRAGPGATGAHTCHSTSAG